MYLPEKTLVLHLLSKDNYRTYGSYLDRKHIDSQFRELGYVYKALDELHELNPEDLTLPELQAFFFHSYPDCDPNVYLTLFTSLSETAIGEETGKAILKQIKERKEALRLSEAAFKFSTGNGTAEAMNEAYTALSAAETAKEDFEFVTDDIEALLDSTVRQSGLRWRLDFLNKSLGSLRKGDFGFLFARPETGKTTILASEISFMLSQLDDDSGPILWFNNEEVSDKVKLRVVQAYFGIDLATLLSNPRKYNEQFNKEVGGKFKIVKDTNIDKKLVERVLKAYPPSLILFDQLPKMKGFAADREDLKIGEISNWARGLAAQYAPTVGVFQAGGIAEGQKWLTMDYVANVTTAAQAEADWILGVGKTHAEGSEALRYLNISKNKLAGDTDSIEALRHGRSEVLIKPTIARYADIVRYD